MAQLTKVPVLEVLPKNALPSPTLEQRKLYMSQMSQIKGTSLALNVEVEDEEIATVRQRLVAAARRLGMNIRTRRIERDGKVFLVAYEKEEEPQAVREAEEIVRALLESVPPDVVQRVAAQMAKK